MISRMKCACGCGQETRLAPRSDASRSVPWVRGEPLRFVRGHNRRKYHGIPTEARCRTCQTTLPEEAFYRDKHRPTGLSSECRECRKARRRKYYAENREVELTKMAEYAREHPEKFAASGQRWRKKHPEKHAEKNRRRRVLQAGGVVEKIDPHAIYERDGGRCHICSKHVPKREMTLDHLVPISRGGDHIALNVRLAHRSCNCRRGVDRIPAQLILA